MPIKLQRILLSIFLFSEPALSQGFFYRCLAPEIEGFGHEHNVAERYVGRYYEDGLKVYATVKKDTLYVQGNYVRPGAKNATKVTTQYHGFPGPLLIELMYRDPPQPHYGFEGGKLRTWDPTQKYGLDLAREYAPDRATIDRFLKTPLFVDPSVFASDFGRVFDGFQDVRVIDKEGTPQRTITINDDRGSSERVVVAKDNYLLPLSELENFRAIEHLRRLTLDHAKLKILSTVVNSDTELALRNSVPKDYRVAFDPATSSADDLDGQIRRQAGNTVFLLGHIEDQDVVARSPDQTEVLRASIRHLQDEARASNVTLFILGCDSAFTADVGVVGVFNSLDIANRLAAGLKQSTVGDFLAQLTPRDTSLLLRRDTLAGVAIEVYDLSRDRKLVGSIILPSALASVVFNPRAIEVAADIIQAVLNFVGKVIAVILAVVMFLLLLILVAVLYNPGVLRQVIATLRQPRVFQVELNSYEPSEDGAVEARISRSTPQQAQALRTQWPESANDGK